MIMLDHNSNFLIIDRGPHAHLDLVQMKWTVEQDNVRTVFDLRKALLALEKLTGEQFSVTETIE